MARAAELKSGNVCEIKGKQYFVKHVETKNPSARGAATLYKVTFNEILTRQKYEETFKGDDLLTDIQYSTNDLQFLFSDGDMYTFMDITDYSQHMLSKGELGEQALWLRDGLEGIEGIVINDTLVGIQLPNTLEFTVEDTAPRMKGATATKSFKPAHLSGGNITVNVPDYIENGEVIKVHTGTKEYISRA